MHPARILKLFRERPYRPLELVLNNGSRLVMGHPEAILVSVTLIALIPEGSREMEFVAPEAVSQIRLARKPRRASSGAGPK